jgi:hypothetical protein
MRADNNEDDNEEEAAKDLRDLLEDKLLESGRVNCWRQNLCPWRANCGIWRMF